MKILVACEESQTIIKAFRLKGHKAFSCDIVDCSGGHQEWHIKEDVLNVINNNWDMMIAHPPCTYLSKVSAQHLYKNGDVDIDRYNKGVEAKEFFMKLLNANIKYICIENPTPLKIFKLPMFSQVINPYEFGHPYSKRTLLWLRNLPGLIPTDIIWNKNVESTRIAGWYNKGSSKERQRIRSKTFPGIAVAMAEQWSYL